MRQYFPPHYTPRSTSKCARSSDMPTDCDIHSHLETGIRCPSCGNDEWTEEKSPFMINPTKLGEEIEQEDVIDIIQGGVRNLDEIGPETLVRIHLYSYLVENSEIRSGVTMIEMQESVLMRYLDQILDRALGNNVEIILTSEFEKTMTEVEEWVSIVSTIGVSLKISFLSEILDCYTEIS